jgi:hypothetical protein
MIDIDRIRRMASACGGDMIDQAKEEGGNMAEVMGAAALVLATLAHIHGIHEDEACILVKTAMGDLAKSSLPSLAKN